MLYIDRLVSSSDTWCNRHVLLECGLGWLRDALCSSQAGMIQFDNAEPTRCWNHREFMTDYASTPIHKSQWHYWSPRCNGKSLDGDPKFAARALIAALRANVVLLQEESPQLAHPCREALALCSVRDFLLYPTPQRLYLWLLHRAHLGCVKRVFPLIYGQGV